MSLRESTQSTDDRLTTRHDSDLERDNRYARTIGTVATALLRLVLAIVGIVLFVFALGQIVGFDLLGLMLDALASTTGQWAVVAGFAMLLIAVAIRGIR